MYKIHKISIYKYYRQLVLLSVGAQNPDIYPFIPIHTKLQMACKWNTVVYAAIFHSSN
jgi:hypothetical protein